MLRLYGVLGHEKDARFHDRLHSLEHRDGVECLFVAPEESGRKRFRLVTDRGTDCAVSLDRGEDLVDGALLFLDDQRAIIARFGAQEVWRLRPRNRADALKLGWNAGNLHWRVRFEEDCLVILLDGPKSDYRGRIAHLLAEGDVEDLSDV
jgi:urease accessory protein